MINITVPFLPPKAEYNSFVDKIYEKNWLTNLGPLATELEEQLKIHLGLNNLLYVGNGTIAIQIALKSLGIVGEVITTPFSYIATTTAVIWENCTPIFADIDKDTFNIDPKTIEILITPKTTAIVATHVYGNPCDILQIEKIAKKHNLKVIYDAAHCFGVRYKGESIFKFGDISTTSFHATKIFHTVEGGAIITNDKAVNYKASKMRNFGHVTPITFDGIGINGKNSEFHAAMGLCNLKYITDILRVRQRQYHYYLRNLKNLPLQFQRIEDNTEYNHAYFPMIFESETCLNKTKDYLEKNQIMTRRYFYPSLSTLDYIDMAYKTPISDDIAERVLCLPLYHTLLQDEQDIIIEKIVKSLK